MVKDNNFHQAIKKHKNTNIHHQTQKKLNKPLKKNEVGSAYKGYLGKLVKLLESGEVDLMTPQSLLNPPAYGKLSEKDKARADQAVVNIAHTLQQIQKLWKLKNEDSFQLENLVESVWQMKERIESEFGDVYKI